MDCTKANLEFAISEIEPSLKNTISHLLTNTRVTDAESSGGLVTSIEMQFRQKYWNSSQISSIRKIWTCKQILLRNKLLQSNKKSQIRSLLAKGYFIRTNFL